MGIQDGVGGENASRRKNRVISRILLVTHCTRSESIRRCFIERGFILSAFDGIKDFLEDRVARKGGCYVGIEFR